MTHIITNTSTTTTTTTTTIHHQYHDHHHFQILFTGIRSPSRLELVPKKEP